MHKALQANAPLPNPYLVTLFLQHFNVPLEDEPFVKFKRSFAIGAGAVASFEYRKDEDGLWVLGGGNRPGQTLKGPSLAYDEFFRPEPDL